MTSYLFQLEHFFSKALKVIFFCWSLSSLIIKKITIQTQEILSLFSIKIDNANNTISSPLF